MTTSKKRSMTTHVFFFPAIVIALGGLVLGLDAKHAMNKGGRMMGEAPTTTNQALAGESKQECWARLSKVSGADLNGCNIE